MEIREDFKSSEGSDDQHQSAAIGSRGLISRFENSSTTKRNRAQSQESSQKSTPSTDPVMIKLYEDTKRKLEELNQKVERLERDLIERDQVIEKLVSIFIIKISRSYSIFFQKTSQYMNYRM